MAELDIIPQIQTVEIATIKIEETTFNSIKELNETLNNLVLEIGSYYLRKKEIEEELLKIDGILESNESKVKGINIKLSDIGIKLNEKYPQARININDGTLQYQPLAPTKP